MSVFGDNPTRDIENLRIKVDEGKSPEAPVVMRAVGMCIRAHQPRCVDDSLDLVNYLLSVGSASEKSQSLNMLSSFVSVLNTHDLEPREYLRNRIDRSLVLSIARERTGSPRFSALVVDHWLHGSSHELTTLLSNALLSAGSDHVPENLYYIAEGACCSSEIGKKLDRAMLSENVGAAAVATHVLFRSGRRDLAVTNSLKRIVMMDMFFALCQS